MSNYIKLFIILIGLSTTEMLFCQTIIDSSQTYKDYTNLDSALQEPDRVYRLDLSNQNLTLNKSIILDSIWPQFINLEYLSLKNDHLKRVPLGLGTLTNLKILDLSGNDFELLPTDFKDLDNLQELYLNNDRYFKFEQSIPLLSELSSLRTLHIENDNLTTLPKNLYKLSQVESLYINNNEFKQIPNELKSLENLKYVDLRDNKYEIPPHSYQNQGFGFKISF